VCIVELPGVPAKGDVSDYLDAHSKDELVALLKAAVPYTPTTRSEPVSASSTTEHASEKAGKKKAVAQGRSVELHDPEAWPEAVDGAVLLDAIVT